MTTLFVIYYATLAGCVISYIGLAVKFRFRLASASNFAFAYAFLLIALPGFYVAEGTAHEVIEMKFGRGLDRELYLLYLAFMPIVSSALFFGYVAGRRVFVKTALRNSLMTKGNLLTLITCGYCFGYLLWLQDIPLNNLLFSSQYNLGEIVLQRIRITHGLGFEENLPFIFRYWRDVAQYILPALCYFYFLGRKIGRHSLVPVLLLVLYTCYLQLFTLEKAPITYFLVGMVFVSYLRVQGALRHGKRISFRLIIRYGVAVLIIFGCMSVIYKYFMGVNESLFKSVASRLASQSASDYVQIEYIRRVGFLGFSGIKMPILSQVLNLEFIDPSKYAISVMYPQYVTGEIMGAAGGMSLTNLYFIMGWFSAPCFFVFVVLFAFFDRIALNSIYNEVNHNAFYLNISFYAMVTVNFAIAVGSYIWMVFRFPTILSPPLWIITCVYLVFIRMPSRIYEVYQIRSV